MNAESTSSPRRSVAATTAWIIGGGFFGMLLLMGFAWMQPMLYSDEHLRQEAFRNFGTRITTHEAAVRDGRTTRPLRVALTPLVDLEVTIVPFSAVPDSARGGRAPSPLPPERYRLHRDFQWEIVAIFVLAIGLITALVYHAGDLLAAGWRTSHAAADLSQPDVAGSAGPPVPERPADGVRGAEEVFARDTRWLHARADELNRRSIYYLVGGLVISAMGIMAFFFFTRQAQVTETTRSGLIDALRPAAVLVFVEGLAFYLLRQHTALLREHGRLTTLILKRNNWVAACRLLGAEGVAGPAGAAVLTALCGEAVPNPADDAGGAAADGSSSDGPGLSKWLSSATGGAAGRNT